MEHNLMTVKDVADYMRLSEQTIQRWVMKREIEGGSLPLAPARLRRSSATPSAGLCPATPRWGDLSPQTPPQNSLTRLCRGHTLELKSRKVGGNPPMADTTVPVTRRRVQRTHF
jgi:hypothetical protein